MLRQGLDARQDDPPARPSTVGKPGDLGHPLVSTAADVKATPAARRTHGTRVGRTARDSNPTAEEATDKAAGAAAEHRG